MKSGKKKARRPVISLGEVRSHRAYERLFSDLEAFCGDFPDEEPWSLDQFFGSEPSDQDMEVLGHAYLDWLAFDYQAWEDGRTVLERFAEYAAPEPGAAEMLQAWRESRMGLFQIVSSSSESTLLKDCFTGAEYAIQADAEIEPLTGDDLVICRVLRVGDQFHLGFDVRTTAARPLELVRASVERELMRMRRQMPDATWEDLFKLRWPVVHDAITTALAAGSAQRLPVWQTPPSTGRKFAGANSLQDEVADLLGSWLKEEDLSHADRLRATQLWWDAAALLNPTSGRPDVWAAGAGYAYLHFALADGTSQAEVAESVGVSVSALSARARAIAEALGLEDLDDRYADPLDPRVRFRNALEPIALRAVAEETSAVAAADQSAAHELLLNLGPDDPAMLTLLGQSAVASGRKKEAKAYADRAKQAYLQAGTKPDVVLRLVELLAELGDDEGILAVTAGHPVRELDGPVIRRMAIARSRGGELGPAQDLLEFSLVKGEPVHLVGPFIDALRLMQEKRIPIYKLDYEERLIPLLNWVPKLNALTRSHLVAAVFRGKAKEAVQAVRAIGAQRDAWAGRLLTHLAKQTDLPLTVQKAIATALNRR